MKKIKWFDTEREAEKYLKSCKHKIKGYKPTIQGNAVVYVKKKLIKDLNSRPTFYGFKKKTR